MNEFPGSEDEQIRRLLNDAVTDVDPGDSLDSIHARTHVTSLHSRRPWLWGAGAAVVATAATISAVAALGGGPGTTRTDPGFAGGPSGAPTGASATPGTRTTDDSSGAAGGAAVPVYYVGDTSYGPRLFREFASVKGGSDTVTLSAYAAVQLDPSDPDYRNVWNEIPDGAYDGAGVGSVSHENGVLTVDMVSDGSDLHSRPAGMSADEADLAIQQVIYSVQAAVQQRDPVQFLLNGEHSDTVLGVPTSEPLAEGTATDVLAQVWIIDPAEGAQLHAPFDVSGVAASFEANVQWELKQGDRVVKKGFTTAKECCTMSPYTFTVEDVPAGDYTLVVHDEDASGGAEGAGVWQDTKDITVLP